MGRNARQRSRSAAAALLLCACGRLLDLDNYTAEPPPLVTTNTSCQPAANTDDPAAPGLAPARPPPRPLGAATPSKSGQTLAFAAKAYFFGDDAGNTNGGWRTYGYDIDGLCTTTTSEKGACKPQDPLAAELLLDGDRCRDNTFGSQATPLLYALDSNYQANTNRSVFLGDQTLLLVLENVDGCDNDPYVPGKIYVTTPNRSAGYVWDGTDEREIDAASVQDNDLAKPKQSFPDGYIANGMWINGSFNQLPFDLTLPFSGSPVTLRTLSTTIAMVFDGDVKKVATSTLSSVVSTAELIGKMRELAKRSVSCNTLTSLPIDQYFNKLNRNSDLVSDPKVNFVDPSRLCDATSLGFRIQWSRVQPPKSVKTIPPRPPTCASSTPN